MKTRLLRTPGFRYAAGSALVFAIGLFGVLTRVLIDVQERGDALVLLEAEQPVFHVTVARRLAGDG